jgi:hypothetical protein
MSEGPKVGELVDDDRLERIRRSEHEAPAEHQPTLARRAAPTRSGIADRDRLEPDAEGSCVVGDGRLDRNRRLLSEPSLEDAIDVVAIARGETDVELEVGPGDDSRDARSSGRRLGEPKAMEVAPETDRRAVGEPAPGCELGSLAAIPVEVTADPALPSGEELVDPRLGMGPAAARRWRNGHDEPELRVDRDPEVS